MKHNVEKLSCGDCAYCTHKDKLWYCTLERNPRFSWNPICEYYKPKATEQERLTCMDCANYTYLDDIGRCPLRRITPEPETPACSLFKPKATEPEPEQEEDPRDYTYLGEERSSLIVGAISRFMTDKCTHYEFIQLMWRYGFLPRAARDLAHQIELSRVQRAQLEPLSVEPFSPRWRVYLDTLREMYLQDIIDMDVVLAALDPSRSGSDVIGDLVSAWEDEKERVRYEKEHLDYLRDMIDIHKPPEQMYGSLEDHKKLSEMYGARRYGKDDAPTDETKKSLHERYVDWRNWFGDDA